MSLQIAPPVPKSYRCDMTRNDEGLGVAPLTPAATVAQQIRRFREQRGWSAAFVAARCAVLGMPTLDRSAIANIEIGRRRRIGVDELLVLAAALDVAPMHLLVPLDDRPYVVTPTRVTNAGRVREWVRGNYLIKFPALSVERGDESATEDAGASVYYGTKPTTEWQPPPRDAGARPTDIANLIDAIEDGTVSRTPEGEWTFAKLPPLPDPIPDEWFEPSGEPTDG
jgi:transcriptional regulator with XRE-family HTH domain